MKTPDLRSKMATYYSRGYQQLSCGALWVQCGIVHWSNKVGAVCCLQGFTIKWHYVTSEKEAYFTWSVKTPFQILSKLSLPGLQIWRTF